MVPQFLKSRPELSVFLTLALLLAGCGRGGNSVTVRFYQATDLHGAQVAVQYLPLPLRSAPAREEILDQNRMRLASRADDEDVYDLFMKALRSRQSGGLGAISLRHLNGANVTMPGVPEAVKLNLHAALSAALAPAVCVVVFYPIKYQRGVRALVCVPLSALNKTDEGGGFTDATPVSLSFEFEDQLLMAYISMDRLKELNEKNQGGFTAAIGALGVVPTTAVVWGQQETSRPLPIGGPL